jgi:isopentenyldiphosphate isomerase
LKTLLNLNKGAKMELLDVVDESGNYTGEIIDRNEVHSKGLWHKEVAVWVFNENGDVLLQRRSSTKKMAPNKLSICEGHVSSKSTPVETAKIELTEELGVDVPTDNIFYLTTEKKQKQFAEFSINRIFNEVFYTTVNKQAREFIIQEEELSEVVWINYLDFKNRILNSDDEIIIQYAPETKRTFELLDNIYNSIITNKKH